MKLVTLHDPGINRMGGGAPQSNFVAPKESFVASGIRDDLNCSAWHRLKLNTKMGLNHHTTPRYTTPHPTTLHHQELLDHF